MRVGIISREGIISDHEKLAEILNNSFANVGHMISQDIKSNISDTQWRTQDFLMGGVSVTSHHDDVKILRHDDVTSLAVSI